LNYLLDFQPRSKREANERGQKKMKEGREERRKRVSMKEMVVR
jgi:hypothetical protein